MDKSPKKIKKKFKDMHWKTGFFHSKKNKRKIKFRSSYEEAIFKILEEDKSVIKYEYEPIVLFFNYKGRIRKYFPDILLYYIDNTKKLIEIKPSWRLVNPTLYLRLQLITANDYAIRHNITFEVWDYSAKNNQIVKLDFPKSL